MSTALLVFTLLLLLDGYGRLYHSFFGPPASMFLMNLPDGTRAYTNILSSGGLWLRRWVCIPYGLEGRLLEAGLAHENAHHTLGHDRIVFFLHLAQLVSCGMLLFQSFFLWSVGLYLFIEALGVPLHRAMEYAADLEAARWVPAEDLAEFLRPGGASPFHPSTKRRLRKLKECTPSG